MLKHLPAALLLIFMAVLAGGAALRESVTVDEVAHIGAGLSYLQKFDLRLNEEHPPLAKVLAAIPLALRGTYADYNSVIWTTSNSFMPAYLGQWVFGGWLLAHWNQPAATLAWARLPMLLLTLLLGWVIYAIGCRLGGIPGGLLALTAFVTTPVFLTFGPLVLTDIPVTLFSLLTAWTYAELWRSPDRRTTLYFALSLAGAMLSKFSSGILLFAIVAAHLSLRWRPLGEQPLTAPEARAWRKLRWRATWKGVLWAALAVYVVYFILSWNQSTDILDRVGHGSAIVPIRRLLMPPWLYLRGLLLVAVTASRPTFILGQAYPHGVWFYYPVLLFLKSSPGFLGLLLLAVAAALTRQHPAIPKSLQVHWRVLWIFLAIFTVTCMLGRLDISFRHFTVPLALLILLLAPVPRMLSGLFSLGLVTALAAACLVTPLLAYPYFFPYVNPLALGHPAYEVMNDSNVDWNQSLPEVAGFVRTHGIHRILLDQYAMSDPKPFVPEAEIWNCHQSSPDSGGQWAAVSANVILDSHNCRWLLNYPHAPLAGGSMYTFQLPPSIPPAGTPGGPPLPADYHKFFGVDMDVRGIFLDVYYHPETIDAAIAHMSESFARPKK